MRKLIITLLLGLAANVVQAELWTDDYEAALAQAKAEKRFVLLNFSGSDWCGWCIRLEQEVFSQKAFTDYAKTNLVCVLLDFPRKRPISEKIGARNGALHEMYSAPFFPVFPSIVLLNSDGKAIARTGYHQGGAEAYVTHLESLLAPHRKPQATVPTSGAPN